MNVGSLFSGVGGLDLGLQKAGHTHAFFCESDPYRRRVLARHWPGVPCFEDVHNLAFDYRGLLPGDAPPSAWRGVHAYAQGGRLRCVGGRYGEGHTLDRVDLIAGGFPCQDLSVAGRRAGLDGSRSGLFFEFARIADALLPDGGWVLIENVPGLLSSNGGRDFAVLLSTLGEIGFHDLAWRVLDSRYLGVPQRRRRVFILARRSRGRRASEVLLEPESGGGDFEAGREAGPRVAGSLEGGSGKSGGPDDNDAQQGRLVGPELAAPLTKGSAVGEGVSYPGRRKEDDENLVAKSLTASERWDGETETFIAHTLRSEGFDAGEDGTGRGTPLVTDRVSDAEGIRPRVAGPAQRRLSEGGDGEEADPDRGRAAPRAAGGMDVGAQFVSENQRAELRLTDHARQLTGGGGKPGQGYPAVLGTGEAADSCAFDPRPDGPRYAACGDAVTVNVSHWIGKRLMEFA